MTRCSTACAPWSEPHGASAAARSQGLVHDAPATGEDGRAMSKASEWAKTQPRGIEGDMWAADVGMGGMMSIIIKGANTGVFMVPSEALELARWILDTFEDK